ncbi:MAG: peptidoglycan-binding protein [Marinobacter sp. 34-60-7]|nr:MAG: peptidoglycan-binding protein [Marinobacter sp. 34-60-7]
MTTLTRRIRQLSLALGAVTLIGTAAQAQANNEIVALKHALYGAGYDITNVNATMDDATREALTQFQQDQGLDASGTLNEATEQALGLITVQQAAASSGQSDSMSAAVPAQSASNDQPAEAASNEGEDAIEEDEDGGWSLW